MKKKSSHRPYTIPEIHSLYEQIFRNAHDPTLLTDPAGRIVDVNDRLLPVFGYPRNELLDLSIRDLTSPEGAKDLSDHLDRSLQADNVISEVVFKRRDGGHFQAEVSSRWITVKAVRFFQSIIRELTGRRSAEHALRESEERLSLQSAALEAAANTIIITDATGKIEWVNRAFTGLTGYSPDEAIGKNPGMLKSGLHDEGFYAGLWKTILDGKVWHGEIHNKRKDGSIYVEEMTITPVTDDHGIIKNFIAIKQDITEQKALQDQLLKIQKLESIGTLASGIAHDFNNILGIIIGYSSILERSKNDPQRFSQHLDAIVKAVNRGANLVHQILTFARKTETQTKPVDVNLLVAEMSRMMQETFPKTIELHLDLDPSLPMLMIDQNQLHQALLNLCVNSRDALMEQPEGRGTITILTGVIGGAELKLRYHETMDTDYAVISVKDSGTGIDESIKERLFDPFFTTKEPGKGTGLGLAVVYGIVNTFNGIIDVENPPGGGSIFTLYFPISVQVQETDTDKPAPVGLIPGGDETILIVEDEPLMSNILQTLLEEKGYGTITAADGDEGLKIFAANRGRIDLVITDMGLPKMSGFEMYKKIRTLEPSAKVILASGFLEPQMYSLMKKEGIMHIIGKPYNPENILRLVHDVLHR